MYGYKAFPELRVIMGKYGGIAKFCSKLGKCKCCSKRKGRRKQENDEGSDEEAPVQGDTLPPARPGVFEHIPCCCCCKGAFKSDTPGKGLETEFLPGHTETNQPLLSKLRITATDVARGSRATSVATT